MALASAPGLGCAVLGKIFGVKPKPEVEEVAVAPVAEPVREEKVDAPPPQPEYSEAQWLEYTALAEARVKEAGATRVLAPMRVVGQYPQATQALNVKGGHCYDVALAWMTPKHRTWLLVGFKPDAEGNFSSLSTVRVNGPLDPPAGVLQYCADRDGTVELVMNIQTASGKRPSPGGREDAVQWAVVVGERREDREAQAARQKTDKAAADAEAKRLRRMYYDDEVRAFGREAADFCERCRVMFDLCLVERKDQTRQSALKHCGLSWQNCAAPLSRRGQTICTSP